MLLESILTPAQLEHYAEAVEELVRGRDGGRAYGVDTHPSFYDDHGHTVRLRSICQTTDVFDALAVEPRVFEILEVALGPSPRLIGSEIFERGCSGEALSTFHTDGGPGIQRRLPVHPAVALQVKVQFFLTSMPAEGAGNFVYIPGSHRWMGESTPTCEVAEVPRSLARGAADDLCLDDLPAAKVLTPRAGDVAVFTARLWHGVMPNLSGQPRRSVILRYGPAWTRPYDFEAGSDRIDRWSIDRHAAGTT